MLHWKRINVDPVGVVGGRQPGQDAVLGQPKRHHHKWQHKPSRCIEIVAMETECQPNHHGQPDVGHTEPFLQLELEQHHPHEKVNAAHGNLSKVGSVKHNLLSCLQSPKAVGGHEEHGNQSQAPFVKAAKAQHGKEQVHGKLNRQTPERTIDCVGQAVVGKDARQMVGDVQGDVAEIASGVLVGKVGGEI